MKYLYGKLAIIQLIVLLIPQNHILMIVYGEEHQTAATNSNALEEMDIKDDFLLPDEAEEVIISAEGTGRKSISEEQTSSKYDMNEQEALRQALLLIDKSDAEIDSRELLHDLQNNPAYELLTFTSGGYLIRMLDYALVLEFSDSTESRNPYEDVAEHKKFYAGLMNYLYEDNGRYFGVWNSQTEVELEDYLYMETMIREYAITVGTRILKHDATMSDPLASPSNATASNPGVRLTTEIDSIT